MDVDTASFETEVLNRSHELPVVVDFWASWCAPCRTLGPVLERFEARDRGAWRLVKVDVDRNRELSQRFDVSGIPAVKAFVDGAVVAGFVGALPPAEVDAWLRGFVPDEAQSLVEEAKELGDRAGKIARLEAALEKRPDHAEALLTLAGLYEEGGELGQVRALVSRLPDRLRDAEALERCRLEVVCIAGTSDPDALIEPGDLEGRYVRAHALAVAERWDDAFAELLGIVAQDRGFRDDGARRAMLRLFDRVGPLGELAETWRRRLAEVVLGSG